MNEASGKRDFGSFHSSNVEELIKQSDEDYVTPTLAIEFDASQYDHLKDQFGTSELKRNLFYLDESFCFLNHGAFGLSFKPAVEYAHKWESYAESQPLRFYDRLVIPLLVDLIRTFATKVFKCKPTELALVENCTYAFNSIVNSIQLAPNDQIYIFSTCYGVYKKILRDVCARKQARLVEELIEYPIRNRDQLEAQTLRKLEKALEADRLERRIKYVMVDHIPSNQTFILPVALMANLCKRLRPDVIFILDAAHSLGSVRDFDLQQLADVDLLFTNCHKWFCGPKGTAFLYKSEKLAIKPAVQSHGINSGFNSEFIWSGLRNYSAYLGLYANLHVWMNSLGGFDHAIDYCTNLAHRASEYLRDSWSTDYLVEPSLCSTMVCVKLPVLFVNHVISQQASHTVEKLNYDHAEMVQNFLYFNHRIEVPVKCVQNELYVRISAHLYNNMNDYQQLASAVLYYSQI